MTELAPVARESVSAVRRESSIFGPTLLLIGGRGIAVAVTFVVPLVLARILGPDAFGTYRQLLLIFTTVYGVAQLGMAESLFYFIPSDPRRAGTYAGNAMLTPAAAGAVVAVTLTLIQSPLAAALDNPALQGLLALGGGYLALMLVSAPLEIVLVSRGRHTAASVAYALSDIGRALSMLLPARCGAVSTPCSQAPSCSARSGPPRPGSPAGASSAPSSARAGVLTRTPTVVTVYSPVPLTPPPLWSVAGRLALGSASVIVTDSDALRRDIAWWMRPRRPLIGVISNGMSPPRPTRSAQENSRRARNPL
jgi:hypothetical protein